MSASRALATAVALADYLETYTSEVRLENIVRLAEALQHFDRPSSLVPVTPQALGSLLAALPAEILKDLRLPVPAPVAA